MAREGKVGEARWVPNLGRLCLVVLLLLFGFCLPAQGADLLDRVKNQEINQILRLKVGHSKVLRTPFALTRISVADPDIADLILITEREIYINALAPGVTNISMWGKSRFTSATVTVEADLTLLKEKLHQILPKEKIGVEAAGDSIVLSGEVSGPVAQSTALSLALPYAGGKKDKVVNVMHVGGVQQVMLEVRVAEINRMVADRIGVNFNALAPQGNFGVNQINSLAGVTGLVRSFTGSGSASTTTFTQGLSTALTAMGGWTAAGTLWTVFLDLLKQQNLGRVLAEPNLVTTSGQEASFLAGGEFPIPVPQSGVGGAATITIEYKKFGVQLDFTPTVLDEGKIAVQVHPTVSELDTTFGVAFTLTGGLCGAGPARPGDGHPRGGERRPDLRHRRAAVGQLPEYHQQVSGAGGYSRPGGPVPLHPVPEEPDGAGGPGDPAPGEAHGAGSGAVAHG